MTVGTVKSKICRQAGRLEIEVRVDLEVLSPKSRNSGKVSMLLSGGTIPSSLGNPSLHS